MALNESVKNCKALA
jgi:hypothetical protein